MVIEVVFFILQLPNYKAKKGEKHNSKKKRQGFRGKVSNNVIKEERYKHSTVIIIRVPSINMPVFFGQHRPEREIGTSI